MAVFSVSKYLNRVQKIPSVIVNSVEPRVLLFTYLCVIFVLFG